MRTPVKPSAQSDDDKKKDDEAKKAEEDKEKDAKKKAEEEEKAKKAEEDKKKKDDEAKKAEEDKKKEDEESKAARAAGRVPINGDEDSDRSDETDDVTRSARERERGRIRAIVLSEAGVINPVLAMHMALGTSTPRAQVIEMMTGMVASGIVPVEPARSDSLRDRMAANPNPTVGAGDARPAPNLAQQIVAADKKRRGEAA
jgi:hypothetical protein